MREIKIALAWCGIVVVLCGFSAYQIVYHWKLETDVLALLPDHERDPAIQSLRRIASSSLGRTAFFLVGHAQEPAAPAATHALGTWMAASPLFETVQWDYSGAQHAFFELYFPLRYRVLSPSIRYQLNTPDGDLALVQRLKELLYQPTSSLMTRLLAEDPLLFFSAWFKTGDSKQRNFRCKTVSYPCNTVVTCITSLLRTSRSTHLPPNLKNGSKRSGASGSVLFSRRGPVSM